MPPSPRLEGRMVFGLFRDKEGMKPREEKTRTVSETAGATHGPAEGRVSPFCRALGLRRRLGDLNERGPDRGGDSILSALHRRQLPPRCKARAHPRVQGPPRSEVGMPEPDSPQEQVQRGRCPLSGAI